MKIGNGQFVGRFETGLRRDERPGAYARVCGSSLNRGKQCEQREFMNGPLLNRATGRYEDATLLVYELVAQMAPVLPFAAHRKRGYPFTAADLV